MRVLAWQNLRLKSYNKVQTTEGVNAKEVLKCS